MNHEKLKDLCCLIYPDKVSKIQDRIIDVISDETGLYAVIIQDGNEKVFVIRGTEIKVRNKQTLLNVYRDVSSDYALFNKHLPAQAYRAEEFIKGKEVDIVTGHSLGGTIAQYIGSKIGKPAVTFSAFGSTFTEGKGNIINYGVSSDGIFMSNIEEHTGRVLMIQNPKGTMQYIQRGIVDYEMLRNRPARIVDGIAGHILEDYPPLSQAVEIDKKKLSGYTSKGMVK